MTLDACFKIAYVTKTHGLKGEVTLTLLPDCPALDGIDVFFLEIKGTLVPHFRESLSVQGNKAYIKWEGINTPEAASALKGTSLYLPRKLRPSLPKGEFYSDEVTGFEVIDLSAGTLGKVKEVQEIGPNRHLVVDHEGKEVLIPVHGPFIQSVNKSRKRISVELPEGFLDL